MEEHTNLETVDLNPIFFTVVKIKDKIRRVKQLIRDHKWNNEKQLDDGSLAVGFKLISFSYFWV